MLGRSLQVIFLLLICAANARVHSRDHGPRRHHRFSNDEYNDIDNIDRLFNDAARHHSRSFYDNELADKDDDFYERTLDEREYGRKNDGEENDVQDELDEMEYDEDQPMRSDSASSGNYPTLHLKKNRLLTTISTWPKSWTVSFRIQPKGIDYQYSNIIHFTIGGDYETYGDRIPAVWFKAGSTRLHFASAINGIPNNYWRSQSIPLNQYTSVSISQKKDSKGQYVYSISLNGKQVYSIINKDARVFNNVQIWASDPWYKKANAWIQDFQFKSAEAKNPGPQINPGDTFRTCLEERPNNVHCFFRNVKIFRTIDGTCNNLKHPTWGATNTILRRIVPADYVDGVTIPRGFPGTSPRVPTANEVSRTIFNVEQTNNGNSNGLTVLFMSFGQFLDHDLTEVKMLPCVQQTFGSCSDLTEAFQDPCLPILFNSTSTACARFGRSEPACPEDPKRPTTRQQINDLTAFVDASQVYGFEEELSKSLRVLDDNSGELKVIAGDLLPLDEIPSGFSACSVAKDVMGERTSECRVLGGCSLVGDVRGDENLALHSVHTLWVREHNRIARSLRALNPKWNGELVFQTTRKIIGALWQRITYEEFLPNVVKLRPYSGYNPYTNPSVVNAFAAAAFRYGHSLIPNAFQQNNNNFDAFITPKNKSIDSIPLREAFFNRQPANFYGIEPTMFGLVGNQSNEVDNSFAEGIARKLFVRPGEPFHSDLLALNIQRGRDHGLPTYGAYREICELSAINKWDDLRSIMLPGAADLFSKIYDNPNDIDLFAAGISEIHLEGELGETLELGETFACLIGRQFEAARDGDRFFYKNPRIFTTPQLQAIEKVTVSTVLCENLKGIVSIQPEAFRIPDHYLNRRIACDGIPKLDLSPWKV